MPSNDDKPLTPAQARQKLQEGLSDYLAGNDPGPIVFRLKRTKKANHTYPLKLTQQQRETLVRCATLTRKLKSKIEEAGEGTQIVGVTWDELHKLNDATGEAAYYARSADKNRLLAVQGRVVKHFEEEHAEVFEGLVPTRRKKSRPSNLLYQFKITLLDSHPPIWRRIQVKDCTLDKLHEYIQTAMGWTNSHLHHFRVGEQLYGDPELMQENFEDMDYKDSTTTNLSDILPQNGKKFRFRYEYDFGDSWHHELLFEGCMQTEPKAKYPLCLEGAMACPPEDCGGVWGYADFVEAIQNPDHERHGELLEWVGGSFDPEEFDAAKATKDMRKGIFDWRSEGW